MREMAWIPFVYTLFHFSKYSSSVIHLAFSSFIILFPGVSLNPVSVSVIFNPSGFHK